MTQAFASRIERATALLRSARIVPVIVIDDPDDAVPLARSLIEGGLSCAEITFRTEHAAESIARITAAVPEIFVGAGTVLSPAQAATAWDSGARFMVSPGFNPRVVDYCVAQGIPVYPGICTPTELEAALEKGLQTLKFFPAEPSGGLSFLKAMAAPYGDVHFMPTGGINLDNVAKYLTYDRIVACGGSWMAPAEWIRAKQFDRIRQESCRAADVAAGKQPGVIV
jgi:2-dehydro-3-deoxyphosphogluconate aldolase/(4S)-4-hydroxy-2-oxoglutarate aldolase